MEPALPISPRQLPEPAPELLRLAIALFVESGMTEAEALCSLHAGVLRRAPAIGIRLEGAAE